MFPRSLFFLALVSLLSLSPGVKGDVGGAAAALGDAQNAKAPGPIDGKKEPGNVKEQQEKDYWCKRAAYYKKRIEKAQYEVDKEDELLSELNDENPSEKGDDKKYIDKKIKKTRDRLADAQQTLKDRKTDLIRLEEEAIRKKIPPEWLQCRPVW